MAWLSEARGMSGVEAGSHHAVYLGLASLGQVDDVDPVVVQVLNAAVEVLPDEGARLARKGDTPKT